MTAAEIALSPNNRLPSTSAFILSRLVLAYVRRFPVIRGKWKLMQASKAFLVVPLEPGLYIRTGDPSNSIEDRIIERGILEPDTVDVFTQLVKPGMTVIDVGANIGQYTLLAAKRVGADTTVHAFEPTPRVAANMRRNVAMNHLTNVIVNEAALTDTIGELVFYVQPEDPDLNSLFAEGVDEQGIRVAANTLDNYVAQAGIAHVDLIKIDVEGAEPYVIEGGRQLLSRPDAPILLIEVNEPALKRGASSTNALNGLLKELGYSGLTVATYNRGRPDEYYNVLYYKPEHQARVSQLRMANLPGSA